MYAPHVTAKGRRLRGIEVGAGALVGQLGKLRPIVNRPTALVLAPAGGGNQPPRRLPACPA